MLEHIAREADLAPRFASTGLLLGNAEEPGKTHTIGKRKKNLREGRWRGTTEFIIVDQTIIFRKLFVHIPLPLPLIGKGNGNKKRELGVIISANVFTRKRKKDYRDKCVWCMV